MEIHTDIKAGSDGRVLRLADTRLPRAGPPPWTASRSPAPRSTAGPSGFELPASGGRLDVTYDRPVRRTSAWLWAQGLLAVVLVVLALPGRRRDVDDDLPDEPLVPAQPVEGEGRRARRLRAQAEAEAETAGDASEVPEPPVAAPVPVPQQPAYGEWDATGYTGAQYGSYDGGYGGEQYQGAQQYDPGAYGQQPYQAADPYQSDAYQGGHGDQGAQYGAGQYDPYAYGDPTPAQEGGYDARLRPGVRPGRIRHAVRPFPAPAAPAAAPRHGQ
ncbi:glycosyltransferase family 2 protein [Streptomyces violaceorubidus]